MNKDEVAKVIADRDWWISILPKGWSLIGFSYRDSATIVNEKNQSADISFGNAALFFDMVNEIKSLKDSLKD